MCNLKLGFLSTIDSPILKGYLQSAIDNNFFDLVIICDSKNFSKKNKEIFNQRTNGKLDDYCSESLISSSKNQIPIFFVKNHNDDSCLSIINNLKIDCLINAGTPRKLNSKIINSVKIGVLNIHPGLLPKYRGSCAVEWSIINDDKVANTAHFMTEEYDAGRIIKCDTYLFKKNSDYTDIRIHVFKKACLLLGEVLKLINFHGLRFIDCDVQNEKDAVLRPPISEDELEKLKEKLNQGLYKYQV